MNPDWMHQEWKWMRAFILNAFDNTAIKARFSIQLIENQCIVDGWAREKRAILCVLIASSFGVRSSKEIAISLHSIAAPPIDDETVLMTTITTTTKTDETRIARLSDSQRTREKLHFSQFLSVDRRQCCCAGRNTFATQ